MYCVVYVLLLSLCLFSHSECVPVSIVHSTSSAAVADAVITTSFRSMNISERREEKNQRSPFSAKKNIFQSSVGR